LNSLLELSRIGRLVNPPVEVPLGDLVREALALVGVESSRRLKIGIDPDLPVLYGDRVRLFEVVQNLIENAVKYTADRPDPRVSVGTRHDGDEVVCFVSDNGIGIDPNYHEKVFGLFEQLDPTTEGSGVGLALAKRIVEVHGGRIWVESEGPGRGSTLCFTVPIKENGSQIAGK